MKDYSSLPPLAAPDGVDAEAYADAVGAIRNACGWHIAPTVSEAITLDGTGGKVMPLPTKLVVSVSNVQDDGVALTEGVDYVLSQTCSLVRLKGCWSNRPSAFSATLEHGFAQFPRVLVSVAKNVIQTAELGALAQMTAGPFNMTPPKGSEGGNTSLNEYQQLTVDPYVLGVGPW